MTLDDIIKAELLEICGDNMESYKEYEDLLSQTIDHMNVLYQEGIRDRFSKVKKHSLDEFIKFHRNETQAQNERSKRLIELFYNYYCKGYDSDQPLKKSEF